MRYDDDSFTALDTRDGRRVTLRMKRIKRAMRPDATPADILKAFPNPNTFNAVLARTQAEAMAKADDGDDDDGGGGGASDHVLSRLADLLVESGRFTDRGHALRHLTSHPAGVALVRTHKSAKEQPMSSIESLENIAKTHGVAGVVEIAKNITESEKSYSITEEEFVKLIDTAARVAHPELGALAFEKIYETNPILARAISVIKAWPSPMSLEPMVATGASGFPTTRLRSGSSPGRGDDSGGVDSVGASDAYEQLVKMAEQQRRAGESASQAFERVYLDPANKHLAEAERSANRPKPTTQYPFPR
jgi:hypothetical protein